MKLPLYLTCKSNTLEFPLINDRNILAALDLADNSLSTITENLSFFFFFSILVNPHNVVFSGVIFALPIFTKKSPIPESHQKIAKPSRNAA